MRPVIRRQLARKPDRSPAPTSALGFDEHGGGWYVDAPCRDCGGYRMELAVHDASERELARSRAEAFLTRVHARGGCLGCEARAWRSGDPPASGQPHVWWDTQTGEWMAWHRLAGARAGISLPLGIRTFWAPQEVRAAARALWTADRLPLRVVADAAAVEPDTSSIFYDPGSGRWQLHVACAECGGFRLGLTSFGRGAVEAACDEALTCLELAAREGCPCCRTSRERKATHHDDGDPHVWFDTERGDWLLWQALEDCDAGVTLPLGIGRFDARRALVYKAAAALLFDSHSFLD